jgi:hypothetical protein
MSKSIMPLRPFNLGDGRIGTPGQVEVVPDAVAHTAHAFGNAQILTDEEAQAAKAAGPPPSTDDESPSAQDRDPKVRKR